MEERDVWEVSLSLRRLVRVCDGWSGAGKDTQAEGLARAWHRRVNGHSTLDVAEAQGGARGGGCDAAGASVIELR